MRGVKVQGHASMMRSSSCPGAIISTDHAAGIAALRARQANEQRELVILSQSAQIDKLTAVMELMAKQLGIDIPEGGDNDNSGAN